MSSRLKLGLALGAGSARGYAHIGVLKVLQKHLTIDLIAGSSMGALVGAFYCCGTDLDLLGKLAAEMGGKKLWDVSFAKRGFVKGERIHYLLELLTKGKDFEDVSLPFCCTACDITTGERVVFDSGSIADAVRASISIPGIFVPYEWQGHVLVDGGLVERVPVCAAAERGAEFIIGVDVGYRGEEREQPRKLVDVVQYSLDIYSWENVKHNSIGADVMIVPNVRHLSPSSFGNPEEMIAAGEQAALEALPEILERYGQKNTRQIDRCRAEGTRRVRGE
ncbi:MAG: patatin-like phospholipase family protein [Christensenellales bacterium]|jgi:NTE family protein